MAEYNDHKNSSEKLRETRSHVVVPPPTPLLQERYGQPLLESYSGETTVPPNASEGIREDISSPLNPMNPVPSRPMRHAFRPVGFPKAEEHHRFTTAPPPLPFLNDSPPPPPRSSALLSSSVLHSAQAESGVPASASQPPDALHPYRINGSTRVMFLDPPARLSRPRLSIPDTTSSVTHQTPSTVMYPGCDSLEYYKAAATSSEDLRQNNYCPDYDNYELWSEASLGEDSVSRGYSTERESVVGRGSIRQIDADAQPTRRRLRFEDSLLLNNKHDDGFRREREDDETMLSDGFCSPEQRFRLSSLASDCGLQQDFFLSDVGTATMEEVYRDDNDATLDDEEHWSTRWPGSSALYDQDRPTGRNRCLSSSETTGASYAAGEWFDLMDISILCHIFFSSLTVTGVTAVTLVVLLLRSRDLAREYVGHSAASYLLGSTFGNIIFGLGFQIGGGMDAFLNIPTQGKTESAHLYWKHLMKCCCVSLWFFLLVLSCLISAQRFYDFPERWFFYLFGSERIAQEAVVVLFVQSCGFLFSYFYEAFHRFLSYHSQLFPQSIISSVSFLGYTFGLWYYVSWHPKQYSLSLVAAVLFSLMAVVRTGALLAYISTQKYELGWQSGMRVRLFERKQLKMRRKRRGDSRPGVSVFSQANEGGDKSGEPDALCRQGTTENEGLSEPRRRQRRVPTGRPSQFSPIFVPELASSGTLEIGEESCGDVSPSVGPANSSSVNYKQQDNVIKALGEATSSSSLSLRVAALCNGDASRNQASDLVTLTSSSNAVPLSSHAVPFPVASSRRPVEVPNDTGGYPTPDIPPVQVCSSLVRRGFRSTERGPGLFLARRSSRYVASEQPVKNSNRCEKSCDIDSAAHGRRHGATKHPRGRRKQRHTTVVSVKSVPVDNALVLDAFCLPTTRSWKYFWTTERPRQMQETLEYVKAASRIAVVSSVEWLGFESILLAGALSHNTASFSTLSTLLAFLNVVNSITQGFIVAVTPKVINGSVHSRIRKRRALEVSEGITLLLIL